MSATIASTQRLTVTGIMPLYNKRDTVLEALASMLAQTRPLDEIVIVDDGSTDGSGELVEQAYGNDPRIHLWRQENRGVSAARNRALRAARGDLFAFLDADDKWLPQRIEKQAAVMEAQPDCMLVLPTAILCDERQGKTWIEGERFCRATYLHEYFREDQLPVCSGIMVRRGALDEVGLFDENLRMGEDHDLWLRIMLRFGYEHLAEPVVWYRCCRPQTLASVQRDFAGVDQFFAKHKRTFGRGLRGQRVWRSAYGAVLRRHARWYLERGHRGKAAARLGKAIWTWPFFNPAELAKCGAKHVLGPRAYQAAVGWARKPFRPKAKPSAD
jgi:glycosyltransferase involved in cell wall biosynthesis